MFLAFQFTRILANIISQIPTATSIFLSKTPPKSPFLNPPNIPRILSFTFILDPISRNRRTSIIPPIMSTSKISYLYSIIATILPTILPTTSYPILFYLLSIWLGLGGSLLSAPIPPCPLPLAHINILMKGIQELTVTGAMGQGRLCCAVSVVLLEVVSRRLLWLVQRLSIC